TVIVNVTNVTGATGTCPDANFTNAAANITSSSNVTNSVTSGCLTVTPQTPSLDKAFGIGTIVNGSSSTLTFTVSNPANNPALSNVNFVDTLSASLKLFNATVTGTCTNAAAATTVVANGTTVTVANLNIPAGGAGGSSCTVIVNVTNVTGATGTCPDANFTNAAANITSSSNVTNSVTSGCLTVTPQTPSLDKAFGIGTIVNGSSSTLTFTVSNPANNPALSNVNFVDTLSASLKLFNATV